MLLQTVAEPPPFETGCHLLLPVLAADFHGAWTSIKVLEI